MVRAEASGEAIRLGARVLAERGSGGARREVARMALDPGLVGELTAAGEALGSPLVVRSSSPLEGSGRWAGAFASYLQVAPDELSVAVRGCWASAFSPGTLARYAAEGLEPGDARLAVLLQPFVGLEAGGTAILAEDGAVEVTVVEGSPAGLLQGLDAGSGLIVPAEGPPMGAGLAAVGEEVAGRLAEALRRCGSGTGATAAEWGVADRRVWLLQVGRPDRPPAIDPLRVPEAWRAPGAVRLARLAHRYPGRLGEAMVLPWLAGPRTEEPVPEPPAEPEPRRAWAKARELAAELAAQAWGAAPEEALGRAVEAFRSVLGPDPGEGLERLEALAEVPVSGGARLLGMLEAVAEGLADGGILPHPSVLWYLSPDEAARVVAGDPSGVPSRIGRTRWEPFLAGVLLGEGRRVKGVPAGPGVGAGRLRVVESTGAPRVLPREVVVADQPRPHLAQLLWDAAGVVTLAGGPAAHLFESARSLGVPAVAACRLEEGTGRRLAELDGRYAVAVDGTGGEVAVAPW